MTLLFKYKWAFLGLVIFVGSANAQFDDSSSAAARTDSEGEVEALYDQLDANETNRRTRSQNERAQKPRKDPTNLSELSTLSPFSDIAVIQRRFLPRTGRFDISANGMLGLNNPFFNNMGVGFRGAYYLTEKHGLELQYFWLSSSERDVTNGLKDRNISTRSLVTAKNYMGAAYKWTPVYGKITFMNQKIVPFDLHFQAGMGLTETVQRAGETTLQIGTGQIFAINKGMAFRWDFLWHFYQAQATEENGTIKTTTQDDLFISFGLSFFFPEATYR